MTSQGRTYTVLYLKESSDLADKRLREIGNLSIEGVQMPSEESATDVKVRDVMSKPVITVRESDEVVIAAKLMDKRGIGGVIVVNREANPLGIITERDLVRRITAKNLLPSKVEAGQVMSKPLVTVDSSIDVTEAAKKMNQLNIRRLGVMEQGKLVGLVTSKDIVEITPALIDVIVEKSKIEGVRAPREKMSLAGYCDECSAWSDNLKEKAGAFVCEDCSSDLEERSRIH